MTAGDNQEDTPPYRIKSAAGAMKDFGGIRRLELPLPFPPGSIHAYLVPQEEGWILVDCGMDLPNTVSAYESAGIRLSDIRQTLLTHVHPDHSGLAARIREWSGAPVRMHHREESALKSLREPEHWLGWQDETLRQAGVPSPMRVRIEVASLGLRRLFPNMPADSYIDDGDVIPTSLGPMRAMLTPGHSPGHLCFYLPEAKILLTGDQLLKPRTPHLEWDAEGSALAEFRASLEDLARLDVEWVLPSHGQAFRDHTVRIEFLLEHSRRMAAQICSLRAGGIESPHDLARAFWKRPMNAFEHRNAVFEMLAYLQHPD